MLRPFVKIQVKQIPTPKWTDRNLDFILDFATEYEIESTWEKHTDNAKITFPKNIKLFQSQDGSIFTGNGNSNVILGGSGTVDSPNTPFGFDTPQITISPLIMKGDIITINHGYLFRNSKDVDCYCSTGNISIDGVQKNNDLSTSKNLFKGYVSSVNSDIPIEIKLEDNFYLLKRTPFDKSVWNEKEAKDGNTSLYGLMKHILQLVNDKFNSVNPDIYPLLTLLDVPTSITAKFSLGFLEIGDMTCAQVLDKLKQQYHFESCFRGDVLQFGFPIYNDQDSQSNSNNFFCFRDIFNENGQIQASANIFPEHDLEYSNKDDTILTATVQCKIINSVKGRFTLSGKQKTYVDKLKVFIYWDIITNTFKFVDISKPGTVIKKDFGGEGERHTFYYPVDKNNPSPTINDLVKLGTDQLFKYHYTGFRGCFTTFSFPFIEWNDNVNFLDPIFTDRNGQYKLRKVIYRGGLKGINQQAHLDYKIDVPIPKNMKQISML